VVLFLVGRAIEGILPKEGILPRSPTEQQVASAKADNSVQTSDSVSWEVKSNHFKVQDTPAGAKLFVNGELAGTFAGRGEAYIYVNNHYGQN
jgi:hypothetical protein